MTRLKKVTPDMAIKVIERCSDTPSSPDKKLWMSVITLAVKDTQRKFHKASAYSFFSSPWFDDVCSFAGLDPVATLEIISKIGKEYDMSALDR